MLWPKVAEFQVTLADIILQKVLSRGSVLPSLAIAEGCPVESFTGQARLFDPGSLGRVEPF